MKKNFTDLFPKVAILLIITPLLLSLSGDIPTPKDKFISIEKWMANNKLKALIKSLGGHQENCIQMDLQNLSSDTLYVLLEPGRRLVSADSTLQDIFIVKKQNILLVPFASETITAYGFCCESSMHSPSKDADFDIGYMEKPSWIRLANLIDTNSFPAAAVQSAVWVLSNNHDISSISDQNQKSIQLLKKTVAGILGIEMPWYELTYVNDTSMLFSNRPEVLWGTIDYYVKTNAIITMNIRDKSGKIMATLIKESSKGPGTYSYNLELNVKEWPKGEYTLSIYQDYSNLNLKKVFKL